jgi:hypothetical protein
VGRRFDSSWLARVEDALGRGVPHELIIGELSADLGIPARRARRYIEAVLSSWAERVTSASTEEQRGELVGMTLSVYREARRKGHVKSALAAVETTARLLGLVGPAAQVAVFNAIDPSGALTSNESVRARLDELRAKQLPAGGDDGGAS